MTPWPLGWLSLSTIGRSCSWPGMRELRLNGCPALDGMLQVVTDLCSRRNVWGGSNTSMLLDFSRDPKKSLQGSPGWQGICPNDSIRHRKASGSLSNLLPGAISPKEDSMKIFTEAERLAS